MRIATAITLALVLTVACASRKVTQKVKSAATSSSITAEAFFPASFDTNSFTQEQYEKHISDLRKRIPTPDFSIVVQPPFVVVGDEPPQVVKQHAEETIKWAVEKLKQERVTSNKPYFELRIGIHTGPVVAGVVGIKKFQYDIWGDTVNLAARMEQSGVPGKINISQHTNELVYQCKKAFYRCHC